MAATGQAPSCCWELDPGLAQLPWTLALPERGPGALPAHHGPLALPCVGAGPCLSGVGEVVGGRWGSKEKLISVQVEILRELG